MLSTRRTLLARLRTFGLMGPLLLAAVCSAHAADPGPNGVWLTEKGDARVQVSRCGASLCGKVVWLKEPIDPATGKAQVDDKNRNVALRNRPIIGLQLFIGMRSTGPNAWSGQIYNADDGQIYDSTIAQSGPDRLEVRGCVGPLCGGETWTRLSH